MYFGEAVDSCHKYRLPGGTEFISVVDIAIAYEGAHLCSMIEDLARDAWEVCICVAHDVWTDSPEYEDIQCEDCVEDDSPEMNHTPLRDTDMSAFAKAADLLDSLRYMHPEGRSLSWLRYNERRDTKCECGAKKIKSNTHSDWCPKHE